MMINHRCLCRFSGLQTQRPPDRRLDFSAIVLKDHRRPCAKALERSVVVTFVWPGSALKPQSLGWGQSCLVPWRVKMEQKSSSFAYSWLSVKSSRSLFMWLSRPMVSHKGDTQTSPSQVVWIPMHLIFQVFKVMKANEYFVSISGFHKIIVKWDETWNLFGPTGYKKVQSTKKQLPKNYSYEYNDVTHPLHRNVDYEVTSLTQQFGTEMIMWANLRYAAWKN